MSFYFILFVGTNDRVLWGYRRYQKGDVQSGKVNGQAKGQFD